MRADVGLHVDTTAHCTSIVDFVISSCIAWHRLRIRGRSFWIRKNSFLHISIKHKTVTFLLHTTTFLGFYGRLAQRISLYVLSRTRTTDLENEVSPTVAQPPGTLPSDLHVITDTGTFRKRLKNVLFDRAYHWLLLALLDVSYSGARQISRWLIDSLLHYLLV